MCIKAKRKLKLLYMLVPVTQLFQRFNIKVPYLLLFQVTTFPMPLNNIFMMLSLASFHYFSDTSDLRGYLFNFLCLNNSINFTIIV